MKLKKNEWAWSRRIDKRFFSADAQLCRTALPDPGCEAMQ